ncbi:MAG: SpoIVB peptidase [Bacilli bacterium]|nr:SpoIVB peptidase [Bacilli bacterium]
MKKAKFSLILALLIFSIPNSILAYSNYIIPGGENIGIEIKTKGVIVVGTYEIDGIYPADQAGIKKGDVITKVDDISVNSIDELINNIKDSSNVKLTLKRNDKEFTTNLPLKNENGISKTGLYVKDSITGIGTLSYIDPATNIYGALGHEVLESNTGKMLEVKDGKITSSTVTNIDKSSIGIPGSKNASIDDIKNGIINKNTSSGIFGLYTSNLPNKAKYKVAKPKDVKTGIAKILTVIKNKEIKEYTINIIKLDNKSSNNKNILFEITDKDLIDKTGGIVQGMSGSPIIQGDYIIGAVTHVVVEDPTKGYGIFITNMLEEGERD